MELRRRERSHAPPSASTLPTPPSIVAEAPMRSPIWPATLYFVALLGAAGCHRTSRTEDQPAEPRVTPVSARLTDSVPAEAELLTSSEASQLPMPGRDSGPDLPALRRGHRSRVPLPPRPPEARLPPIPHPTPRDPADGPQLPERQDVPSRFDSRTIPTRQPAAPVSDP